MELHQTKASGIEILGLVPAVTDGKPALILTTRVPGEFNVSTRVISGQQARRLQRDLNVLFEESPILRAVPPLDPALDGIPVTTEEATTYRVPAALAVEPVRKPPRKKK